MRKAILLSAFLPLLVSANLSPAQIFHRSTCILDTVKCGSVCIPKDYTCCPDKKGGCASDEICQMGDNGDYGCCPTGASCTGDGSSEFIKGVGADNRTETTASATASASASATASGSSNGAALYNVGSGVSVAALVVGLAGLMQAL